MVEKKKMTPREILFSPVNTKRHPVGGASPISWDYKFYSFCKYTPNTDYTPHTISKIVSLGSNPVVLIGEKCLLWPASSIV